MPELERETLRRRVLGWGVTCRPISPGTDHGRDVELGKDADGKLDLAQVEKVDNLGQSLEIALTTLLGSDVFNIDFGFDGIRALAEEPNAILARERVRVAVVQLLHKDPRVRRIIDVKLDDDRLDPPPAGSRTLEVRVSFETVSADQASVDLGRVVPIA